MDHQAIVKEWTNFANAVDGSVDTTEANYSSHDNTFRINIGNSVVELTWGTQPQHGSHVTLETRFKYLLNSADTELKIYPRDLTSILFTLFKRNKKKTGVDKLDKSYVIICNSEALVFELEAALSDFYGNNRHKDFSIQTEEITGRSILTLYIPELIVDQKELSWYYQFGLTVSEIISGAAKT